jgi:hypothetical protein
MDSDISQKLVRHVVLLEQDVERLKVQGSAAGVQGVTGAGGNQGVTGAAGTVGNQGVTGAAGPSGNQGVTGAAGPSGNQGVTGAAGTVGNQGVTGAGGNQGVTGAAGPSGNQGVTGAGGNQGVTGAAGTVGNQGVTGAGGNQGVTGVGVQGITGVGIQGVTGVGTQGVTGSQGVTGVAGGSLSYSDNELGGDVTLNAATWSDLFSMSLAAGTWMIVATLFVSADSGQRVISRCYSSSSHFGGYSPASAAHNCFGMVGVVTPGSTTTYKIQAVTDSGAGTVHRYDPTYFEHASRCVAIKIA